MSPEQLVLELSEGSSIDPVAQPISEVAASAPMTTPNFTPRIIS